MKQSGRYFHEHTMSAYTEDEDGDEVDAEESFLDSMRDIARVAARRGYEIIEAENEDDHIDECLVANEYTFTAEGRRMDPDDDKARVPDVKP